MPSDLQATYRGYLAAVVAYHHTVAASLDIGYTDYQAMNVLQLHDGLATGELARLVGLSTSAATRMVDRLERLGYVSRSADPQDRRRTIVRLGKTQPARLYETLEVVRSLVGNAFEGLSPADLEVLERHFTKARDGYQTATNLLLDREAAEDNTD
ncbi:MarR family winged helix-turn-helix transcriptional regulator [Kribbella sp. NBC_00359]|uniref:MarR family winged helix-turn-helix transcriptional regulator n=1 Tax=Kribbella sp. NBC_00359 TaxID=2975966 RepID=UPI002E1B05D2